MHTIMFVILYLTTSALAVNVIEGAAELDPAQSTIAGAVQIIVHSHRGSLIESAPIRADGKFSLYSLPEQSDGTYILHVFGSMLDEYVPLLLLLQAGSVKSVLSREHALMIVPESEDEWPRDNIVNFVPIAKTNYLQRARPWSWRDIWRYKIRFLQLAAAAFVVWFPTVIRDLPKEMREELMGEKEVDLGDTNAHIKGLLGRTDIEVSSNNPQQR